MPIFSLHTVSLLVLSTISYQKQDSSFYSSNKGRHHIEAAFSRPSSAVMDLTLLLLVLVLKKGL